MKLAVPLVWLPAPAIIDVAQAAEELGYESVWASDHLVLPAADASGHTSHGAVPATMPLLDPIAVLAKIAGVTRTLRLGTWAFQLPARHALAVARSFQTLDVLSDGRAEAGFGLGYDPGAFAALGIDFGSRGRRADEAIRICRSLWAEGSAGFDGEFATFAPVVLHPGPAAPGGPAAHVGGRSEAAFRRAAELGDGWIGTEYTPGSLAPDLARLRAAEARAGRSVPLQVTVGVGRIVNPTLPPVDPQMIEEMAGLGVDRAIVRPWRRTGDALGELERLARQVPLA